jgi:hypothetical protein
MLMAALFSTRRKVAILFIILFWDIQRGIGRSLTFTNNYYLR